MKLLLALAVLLCMSVPTHQGLAAPPASPAPSSLCSSSPCVPVIRFNGRVDDRAQNVLRAALALANRSHANRIILELNTDGGDVDAGFEMVRAIEDSHAPVTCVVDYKAYSMGFYILQSCSERVMTYRASLLAHEVRNPSINETTVFADRLQSMSDALRVLNRGFAEHCSRRMGLSLAEYLSHVGGPKDWFMDWETALRFHAVDRVATTREVYEGYAHPTVH